MCFAIFACTHILAAVRDSAIGLLHPSFHLAQYCKPSDPSSSRELTFQAYRKRDTIHTTFSPCSFSLFFVLTVPPGQRKTPTCGWMAAREPGAMLAVRCSTAAAAAAAARRTLTSASSRYGVTWSRTKSSSRAEPKSKLTSVCSASRVSAAPCNSPAFAEFNFQPGLLLFQCKPKIQDLQLSQK